MSKFLNSKKGFTLVELLIVIAILALLATIVVASTVNARSKAKDSAIKASLSSLRSGGELWGDNHGSYSGFCADNDCSCATCSADWRNVCAAVKVQNSNQAVNCYVKADNSGWCASSRMVGSTDYFCVDSTNKAQIQSVPCSTGACE